MATAVHYDPSISVLTARTQYFVDNQFGDDGGYSAKWVTLAKLGPLKLGFPNTAGRIRAVRCHDLHHLVTGYDTDFVGEAEIAAWELASGCQGFPTAALLNHLAMPIGVLRAPARTAKAFARGCNSKNLYAEPFTDALLDERLGDLRNRLGVIPAAEIAMTSVQRRQYRRSAAIGMLSVLAIVLASLTLLVAIGLAIAAMLGGF